MGIEKIRYDEVSRAKISQNRNMVVSRCSKGGYTVAQQLIAKDGKSEVAVFLKGAIHIEDVEALKRVRDAIDVAIHIEMESNKGVESTDWDG